MTNKEFIQLLSTFPPNDIAKLYCPVDKTYYYVYYIGTQTNKITLMKFNQWVGYRYLTCIKLLKGLPPLDEISFNYAKQTFVPLGRP
jgi:hypothetical protein